MQHGARTLIARQNAPFRRVAPGGFVSNTQQRRALLTLAIETSCDDTCVAIVESQDRRSVISARRWHGRRPDGQLDRQVRPEDDAKGEDATTLLPAPPPSAQIHFNDKVTAKNSGKGGIHPLEALSSHKSNLAKLVSRALDFLPAVAVRSSTDHTGQITGQDGVLRHKPDFISVTRGPGMRSNLMCGLEFAKGLAVAWQVPMVGVHHMQAHALTPRLVHATEASAQSNQRCPEFPFLTLLVSGGHTMLLYSTGLTEHKILASTVDVAIGDALDRTGWLLLPEDTKAQVPDSAFGKYLSQYAFPDQRSFASWPVPHRRKDEIDKPLNRFGWQMRTPLSDTRDMMFSFGSIESRVEGILRKREATLQRSLGSDERILLAQAAVGSAFEHIGSRIVIALGNLEAQGIPIQSLVISGGVAANNFLRYYLRAILTARGLGHVDLVFPPIDLCTDNAAMIGWTGIEMFEAGFSSDLSIDALRKWSMDPTAEDGGIVGIGGWRHGPFGLTHQMFAATA